MHIAKTLELDHVMDNALINYIEVGETWKGREAENKDVLGFLSA